MTHYLPNIDLNLVTIRTYGTMVVIEYRGSHTGWITRVDYKVYVPIEHHHAYANSAHLHDLLSKCSAIEVWSYGTYVRGMDRSERDIAFLIYNKGGRVTTTLGSSARPTSLSSM